MPKRKSSSSTTPVQKRSKKRTSRSWKDSTSFPRATLPSGSFASSLQLSSAGMPQKIRTCQRYHETVQLNPGISGFAIYEFAANGMYDPNITGTGHQPSGFDQMMTLYNHYTVTKSIITVTPATTGSTNQQILFGVRLNDTTGQLAGGLDSFLESRGVKYLMVGYPGATVMPVNMTVDMGKFFGVPQQNLLGESQFRGSAVANPSELAIYQCFVGAAVPSDDPPSTTLHVDITFECVFSEPKEIIPS